MITTITTNFALTITILVTMFVIFMIGRVTGKSSMEDRLDKSNEYWENEQHKLLLENENLSRRLREAVDLKEVLLAISDKTGIPAPKKR